MVKALETVIKSQVVEIRTLQDIEKINKLQRAYGYYLEHWMAREIIDLFSDGPDVSLTLFPGTFVGKDRIKEYFAQNKPGLKGNETNNEFYHQMMQVSGIVDVDLDGKTAKGRWYGFGAIAIPLSKGIRQEFMSGIYIAEYV